MRFFSADDYLTNSLTSCLMQDSRGFLWMGSRYGVTRYDGHRFRHFTHQDNDTLSLRDNNVLCMTKRNNDGLVLIGTSSQLVMYDYQTQTFHSLPIFGSDGKILPNNYVRCLATLPDGNILGAAAGLGIFRIKAHQKVARHIKAFDFAGFADVIQITSDKNGTIWMLTEHQGVCRIKKEGGKYHMKKYLEKEPTALTAICTLPDGRVIIGAAGKGIYLYYPKSDNFQQVSSSAGINVLSLCATRTGRLLVGTEGQGMLTFIPAKSNYTLLLSTQISMNYWKCPANLLLGEQKVSCIMEDSDGNIWMALLQKGLLMQPRQKNGFVTIGNYSATTSPIGTHCVMSVMAAKNGQLWIGTDNDGIKNLTQRISIRGNKNTIMGIAPANNGMLWLATYLDGCQLYDPQTDKYTQLPCTSTGDALHVMAVKTDNKGRLWIATNGDGLICYFPKTGLYKKYKYDPMHLERTNIVCNNWVNCLTLSRNGRYLYIGTSSGLMSLELSTLLFDQHLGHRILLMGSAIHAIREDYKGNVWAATSTGLYNMSTGKAIKGLPATDVASLEVATDGTIWAGTIHGLCHYDPQKGKVCNYFVENGLQGNEYSNGASTMLPDGRMVFGGSGGISIFHPENITKRNETLSVKLTGITLNGQEVTTTTRSGWLQVCEGTVMDSHHFSFAATDNSLTLNFSTMNFALADGIQYAYRLNGGDWQFLPRGTADLTLNHLSPGSYHIDVKAMSGVAESHILSLDIIVRPPLYATWWAYLLYLLTVAFIIWRIFANRNRLEQARLRLQEHVHAADLREQRLQSLQQLLNQQMMERTIGSAEELKSQNEPSPDEQLLEKIIRIMKSHLDDSDFSVELLAKEVALSRSQLHRRLKGITGQSVSDFIRSMRLKHAAQLLENGCQNISEVAYACGFETPSSFSTAFKKFYGVAPSDFIKK